MDIQKVTTKITQLSPQHQQTITKLIDNLAEQEQLLGTQTDLTTGLTTDLTTDLQPTPDLELTENNNDIPQEYEQKPTQKPTQKPEQTSVGKQDRAVRRPPITQVQKIPSQSLPEGTPFRGRQADKQKSNNHIYNPQKATARILPFDTNAERPNLFVENNLHKLHRKDVLIDKKLSGNNDITPRNTRSDLVTVKCNMCGNMYEVSNKLVYRSDEGIRFVCDKCQQNKR